MALKIVGYWAAQGGGDGYPDVMLLPRSYMPDSEAIAEYLDSAPIARSFRGYSGCRLCGCQNGSRERSDGTYIWPEGLSHYVRSHGLVLPDFLADHIRTKILRAEPHVELDKKDGFLKCDDSEWKLWASENNLTVSCVDVAAKSPLYIMTKAIQDEVDHDILNQVMLQALS